jgi:hypothetical protein
LIELVDWSEQPRLCATLLIELTSGWNAGRVISCNKLLASVSSAQNLPCCSAVLALKSALLPTLSDAIANRCARQNVKVSVTHPVIEKCINEGVGHSMK